MANEDIKMAAKQAKVKHYEISAVLNIRSSDYSCKLRYELPKQEKEKILKIIETLSGE